MRILIVAATGAEIDPLLARLRFEGDAGPRMTTYALGNHTIDVLTTGVGMVATAVWCSRALTKGDYGMALNLGVCGSFDPALTAGTVVHVLTEQLPEQGAEDDEAFLTLEDLQLQGADDFPMRAGRLMNAEPPDNDEIRRLPTVHGITVNTVHGNERSIAAVRRRCQPQVESMEGAAFMYACLVRQVPFAEVRAVSNVVEKRNRSAWKLGDAIASLASCALRILDRA